MTSDDAALFDVSACMYFDVSSSRLVVVGDFNYPNIDWDELTCDAHSQRFLGSTP